jgi:hypothetical protein
MGHSAFTLLTTRPNSGRHGEYCTGIRADTQHLQGCLAHKKQTPPLGPTYDHRYSPTVGSWEGGVSYERGTPAHLLAKLANSYGVMHRHPTSGRGAARAEDAQGTPTQSNTSPSVLVYEAKMGPP